MSLLNSLLVLMLTAAGCSNGNPVSPDSNSPTPGDRSSGPATVAEVELRLDEVFDHQGLKLRWLELDDSRCPIGVACIWEGQIVATIEVVRDEETPVKVELLNRAGRQPEAGRAFDHELVLLGVDPHPTEGVTPERDSYTASVEITSP